MTLGNSQGIFQQEQQVGQEVRVFWHQNVGDLFRLGLREKRVLLTYGFRDSDEPSPLRKSRNYFL